MIIMRPTNVMTVLAAFAVGFAVFGVSANAAQPTAAIAEDGRVLEARGGTLAELFPSDEDDSAAHQPVMVLEIADADGAIEKLLVPGTDDAASERNPLVLYDRARDALNVLYERVSEDGVSLRLASYGRDGWSKAHELLGYGPDDGQPIDHALTRASLRWQVADGAAVHSDRTILHIVGRDAEGDVRYTPLIFLEGAYVGWNDTFSLLDFFDVDAEVPGSDPATALSLALTVREDADGNGLSVAFVDPRSDHLVVLDIAIQPLELVYFAAEVRTALEALVDDFQAGSAESIRGPMRATIIFGGTAVGLEQATIIYLADMVDSWIQDWATLYPEADFATFSEAFRTFLDDLILALFAQGDPDEPIEIDLEPDGGSKPALSQLIDVRVVSARPAPKTGPGLTQIYPSADGERVLIAWFDHDEGAVRYVESSGDPEAPWGVEQVVRLREGFGLGRIHTLLGVRAE